MNWRSPRNILAGMFGWPSSKAKKVTCSHHVAAKRVSTSKEPKELSKEDEETFERLKAQSLGLDHVCAFHGTMVLDNQIYLIMDAYKESLHEKLKHKLNVQEIRSYGMDILCGVSQLHTSGIICMKIKPSNILLDEKGRAHISDFGTDLILRRVANVASQTPKMTLDIYEAPERWNGEPPSIVSDIWSVGCILLKMCTGASVWGDMTQTQILEHVNNNTTLPLSLQDHVEGHMLHIIASFLTIKAHERPETLSPLYALFLKKRQDILIKNPLSTSPPSASQEVNDDSSFEEVNEDSPPEEDNEEYGPHDVILACQKGSIERLKQLHRSRVDFNTGGPLCMAILSKEQHEKEGVSTKDILELLVRGGADPSQKDDKGQSPLHIAAMRNDKEAIHILISMGGDVNVRNIRNATPLHIALKYHARQCVEYLMELRADYNLQDNDGESAFHVAVQAAQNNLDLFAKMLERDAAECDVLNAKNYRCDTLTDLLKRVPQKWISKELQLKLKSRGVDVQVHDEVEAALHEDTTHVDIAGLEDAYMAGGKNSLDCTLILAEGTSANQFAKAALQVLGKHKYGSYSFTGNLANLKLKCPQSKHVLNIFQALGLPLENVNGAWNCPNDLKKLRYGHVLMMMDQDADGYHIRGLVINMLYFMCPQLLKIPFFLQDFTTYLYKATNIMTNTTLTFRLQEYKEWNLTRGSGWSVSYYKGLASNCLIEVEEYCKNFHDHIRNFIWAGDIDANYIHRAFNDNTTNDRKRWILDYEEGLYDTKPNSTIGYAEFIKKDLVPYFVETAKRCIPNLMDGLNITPRKVMCCLLEKDDKDENYGKQRTISDLASFVSQNCGYLHRLQSIESSIFSMAKNFCGTNNLNLLEPIGLFGSRDDGGRNADIAYLKVAISPLADLVFPKHDYSLVPRLCEDGKEVQPQWYAPIFPLVLVNGAYGIACGFKTAVPRYDVIDVICNLERLMDNSQTEEMIPSYRGFKGTVINVKPNQYTLKGDFELNDDRTILTIREIPIGIWYDDYEKILRNLKVDGTIEKFEIINLHGEDKVHWYKVFLKTVQEDKMIVRTFQLEKKVSSRIYLCNAEGNLQYYPSWKEVLDDFYIKRLKIYEQRKITMGTSDLATDLWKRDLRNFREKYSALKDLSGA
uniref:DNA topoisomerase (ATP-hydrolyzing) n=1 Tax=Arundo donax TaxID=35708 RepID=A0A0A9CVG2_ARUDO